MYNIVIYKNKQTACHIKSNSLTYYDNVIFIHAALDNKDLSCLTFKFTKSYLNTAHHSLTKCDTLPKKTIILWKEAKEKCILNDDGKPTDGFLFISGNDGNAENCLRMFGFDVYQHGKLSES